MAHVCLRHSIVLGGVCQLYLEELPTVETVGMQEKEGTFAFGMRSRLTSLPLGTKGCKKTI